MKLKKSKISKPKIGHPGANLGKFLVKAKKPSASKIKSIVKSIKKPRSY